MQKVGQRGAATIRFLLVIVLGIACTACASRTALMNYNTTPGIAFQAPTADQAIVVFVRTEPGDTSASVFDGEVFVGVLVGRSYIAQPTTPGEHRFMVISEAADFMDATLDPGRVYFARIESRFGVWRARFSLIPISPLEPQWKALADWLREASLVTPNAAGKSWAHENAPSIHEKHDAYLRPWLTKKEKPKLYPQDGVPFADIPRT